MSFKMHHVWLFKMITVFNSTMGIPYESGICLGGSGKVGVHPIKAVQSTGFALAEVKIAQSRGEQG